MHSLRLCFGVILLALLSAIARGEDSGFSLAPQELSSAIAENRTRVEEFRFICATAKAMGIRVWLFGGTASGFAHYAKWDALLKKGDRRFQPDRFDYEYTNIYRSTQDADIVIDGTPKQAEAFQNALRAQYPHLQGSKSLWEVRLLREKWGDKEALLNNPDFLNQHTDSHSVGMVELTDPPAGESVIRDLRDWGNFDRSAFFEDVRLGKLHYYYSESHSKTSRFKDGRNPSLFSVIRFLIKAFQYELEIHPEDKVKIKTVLENFNAERDLKTEYAKKWVEENGKKLLQHAVDEEYACKIMDELGLRKQLIKLRNDERTPGTLAWWMNKEPLKSDLIGKGNGKTAKELGITDVAHETKDLKDGNGQTLYDVFLIYEAITKAHTGKPNVFVSRAGQVGESAATGGGFYTLRGREGAVGSGFTIRFKVHSNAREGTDFTRSGDVIVFHNKNALEVIPETLKLNAITLLDWISQNKNQAFNPSDAGVYEKLRRKLGHQIYALTAHDKKLIVERLSSLLKSERKEDYISSEALAVIQALSLLPPDPDLIGSFRDKIVEVWKKSAVTIQKNIRAWELDIPFHRLLPACVSLMVILAPRDPEIIDLLFEQLPIPPATDALEKLAKKMPERVQVSALDWSKKHKGEAQISALRILLQTGIEKSKFTQHLWGCLFTDLSPDVEDAQIHKKFLNEHGNPDPSKTTLITEALSGKSLLDARDIKILFGLLYFGGEAPEIAFRILKERGILADPQYSERWIAALEQTGFAWVSPRHIEIMETLPDHVSGYPDLYRRFFGLLLSWLKSELGLDNLITLVTLLDRQHPQDPKIHDLLIRAIYALHPIRDRPYNQESDTFIDNFVRGKIFKLLLHAKIEDPWELDIIRGFLWTSSLHHKILAFSILSKNAPEQYLREPRHHFQQLLAAKSWQHPNPSIQTAVFDAIRAGHLTEDLVKEIFVGFLKNNLELDQASYGLLSLGEMVAPELLMMDHLMIGAASRPGNCFADVLQKYRPGARSFFQSVDLEK